MNTRTKIDINTCPVARIIEVGGEVRGEVKGSPMAIEQIGILACGCETLLACKFQTIYVDDTTLHIKATPQKHHCIRATTKEQPPVNPARALLAAIFRDTRDSFPGSMLRFIPT